MNTKNRNNYINLLGSLLTGALVGAATAGFNYLSGVAADTPLDVLEGDRYSYPWRFGRVSYSVSGPQDGPPLVMFHGIHAAASGYEYRNNMGYFADKGYRVYVPDLVGFGLSDRPAMGYDDELYIAFVSDFLRDVVQAPAVVIALSLTASFVIAAAARYPERFAALVLIAPVGISQLQQKIPVFTPVINSLLTSPVAGELLFNLLTSPNSLRFFSEDRGRTDDGVVSDETVAHYYNLSHQPNARYAPAAFISGRLNRDIREEWASLRMPLLLVWGYRAKTTPARKGPEFLKLNPRAVTNGYDANLLPHDECAAQFNADTWTWLQGKRKD